MCNKGNCGCFSKIIETIIILQQADSSCDINGCDKPFLGNPLINNNLNTRPINFYNNNGETFSFSYILNGVPGTSNVCRCECLDECCCKCRVLAPNPDTSQQATIPYVATDNYFTINLKCICAMQCLNDTFVSGV